MTTLFRLSLMCAILCASLLFLTPNVAGAQQAQPSAADMTISYFYQDPRPERLTQLLSSPEVESWQWHSYPTLVGLLSAAFTLHPEWIDSVLPSAPNNKMATALVAALWLAGQPKRSAEFRTKFAPNGMDPALSEAFAGLPKRLNDLHIRVPTDINVFWGASFAAGDGHYVMPIIEFMAATANKSEPVALDVAGTVNALIGGLKEAYAGLKDKYGEAGATEIVTAAAALRDIRSKASKHPYVKQAVSTYLQAHPGTFAATALTASTSNIK